MTANDVKYDAFSNTSADTSAFSSSAFGDDSFKGANAFADSFKDSGFNSSGKGVKESTGFGSDAFKDADFGSGNESSFKDAAFGYSSDSAAGGFDEQKPRAPAPTFARSGFGDSDSDMGALTPDPFGVVDPFKDVTIKEDDKFSWDDEPDPFAVAGNTTVVSSAAFSGADGKVEDPFTAFDANKNVLRSPMKIGPLSNSTALGTDMNTTFSPSTIDPFNTSINSEISTLKNSSSVFHAQAPPHFDNNSPTSSAPPTVPPPARPHSVLADPTAHLTLPARSKTALADPFAGIDSFDPLASSTKNTSAYISNEDLLNQNFGTLKLTPAVPISHSNNGTFAADSVGSNNFNAFSAVDFDSAFGGGK